MQWLDGELLSSVIATAAGARPVIIIRSATGETTGYRLMLTTSGTINLARNTSTVATVSKTITATTLYKVRFRAQSGYVNVRVWDAAGAEPGTWDIEYVDPSPLTDFRWLLGCLADGSTATARSADFDDVSVTTGG